MFLICPMAIARLCEVVNDRKQGPKAKSGCVEDHRTIGILGLRFHGMWGTQIPLLDQEVVGSDMHPRWKGGVSVLEENGGMFESNCERTL